jgi:hypothetical protein
MKRTTVLASLAATLISMGSACARAQAQHVKMAYSGTSTGASAVNLQQPGTVTVEENFEGNGALGAFTLRLISAETTSPQQPPSTCSGPANIYFLRGAGAGVFRFQDGSLLKVNLTHGSDCIDLSKPPGQGHCVLTVQIEKNSGTGRFKDATGTLTLTETTVPVLADALGNPVFFAAAGKVTGMVSGVAIEADRQEERQ